MPSHGLYSNATPRGSPALPGLPVCLLVLVEWISPVSAEGRRGTEDGYGLATGLLGTVTVVTEWRLKAREGEDDVGHLEA